MLNHQLEFGGDPEAGIRERERQRLRLGSTPLIEPHEAQEGKAILVDQRNGMHAGKQTIQWLHQLQRTEDPVRLPLTQKSDSTDSIHLSLAQPQEYVPAVVSLQQSLSSH